MKRPHMDDEYSEGKLPISYRLARRLKRSPPFVRVLGVPFLYVIQAFASLDWLQMLKSSTLLIWFLVGAYLIELDKYLFPFAYKNIANIDLDLPDDLKVVLFWVVALFSTFMLAKKAITEKNIENLNIFIEALKRGQNIHLRYVHGALLTLFTYLVLFTLVLIAFAYADGLKFAFDQIK